MRIGILGAGHAGLTLFCCLIHRGLSNIMIYSSPQHDRMLSFIVANGGEIRFSNKSKKIHLKSYLARHQVADSIEQLTHFSDVVYNTTPISAHDGIFDQIYAATKRSNKELTYVNLGGGFSIFSHIARQNKAQNLINLGTVHTLPYACRVENLDAHLLNVRKLTLAAFTAGADQASFLAQVFDTEIRTDRSILHMSLDRSSYVMHPLMTMWNVNRIEKGEDFFFYRDGFCDSITRMLVQAGRERICLAQKLGYTDYMDPAERLESFHRNYGDDFKSIRPPRSVDHRFITEDIPYGLVPICGLAKAVGVEMPLCHAIVEVACAMTGQDLWNSNYNLAKNDALREVFLQHV
jgi:opine dehydrogenase